MPDVVKKERPQNANLRPIGTDKSTPERDAAIRNKGRPESHKARRRNLQLQELVRIVGSLGTGDGKVADVKKLTNRKDLASMNIPQIILVIQAQFQKAQEGDIEARNWICRMYGVEPAEAVMIPGLLPVNTETDTNTTRFVMVRGEKPKSNDVDEQAEKAVEDSKEAIAAAMQAVEAAEKAQQEKAQAEAKAP